MKYVAIMMYVAITMMAARWLFDAPAWGMYLSGLVALNYMAIVNRMDKL